MSRTCLVMLVSWDVLWPLTLRVHTSLVFVAGLRVVNTLLCFACGSDLFSLWSRYDAWSVARWGVLMVDTLAVSRRCARDGVGLYDHLGGRAS